MLKHCETLVSFREIPDEISLCINISNCPCHCPGCHSQHLAQDIGEPLDIYSLNALLESNKGVTCVAFMGGDAEPASVNELAVKVRQIHPGLKTAWYSGRSVLSEEIDLVNFDFIKIGPYIEEFGPLDKKTTNQRFYKIEDGEMRDITEVFWRKKP